MGEQLRIYRLQLLERLEQQPREFAALLATLPEPEWHTRRLPDGATLHQVAVHLRDAEAHAFWPRARRILLEERPQLEPFPSHRWSLDPAHGYRADEPLAEIVATFTRARQEVVAALRPITPEGWSRVGVHPPSGPRTLLWWAERMYNHARGHLDDMHRLAGV